MLTGCAVNRNHVTFLAHVVLEQRINANGKVEFYEEEENAKLRDLQTKEHSDDAENESEYQEEHIKHQVRHEEKFRTLKRKQRQD